MPTSSANPNLVKTAIDEVLWATYGQIPAEGMANADTPQLFKKGNTDKAAVIEMEVMGPGKWNKANEESLTEESRFAVGNTTTHNIADWKQNLPISVEFWRRDQHSTIEKAVRDMGRQARNTRDENALDIYAGGFDTTTTPDAAYLWSDSHTNLNGDTIDNLSSGAFTPATFETLVRLLVEQKDQRGRLGGHSPVAFLVPPILFPDANEFLKSELKANSTDNNLNYVSLIYPGMSIFESPWVGSTYNDYTNAQTAHYLVSADHFIRRIIEQELNTTLVDWQFDPKDRYIYKGRFSEVVYAATWEGAVANTGA
jgi:hypothetical protein